MSNMKEWLSKLNIKVASLLTPVAYTEYAIKMLFIIKPKNLLKLFQIDIGLHVICIILSLFIEPYLISLKSIVLSALISTVVLISFILYRISIQKKVIKLAKDNEIKFDEVKFKRIKMPENIEVLLNRYKEEGEKK